MRTTFVWLVQLPESNCNYVLIRKQVDAMSFLVNFAFCTLICTLTVSLLHATADAQCPPPEVNIYDMFSAGGTYSISDNNGQRQIRATAYSVNGCEDVVGRTGTQASIGTRFDRSSVEASSENCYVPQSSSYRQFESFRALVIRTNGWKSSAKLNITNISTAVRNESYADIVGVVGFDGSTQIDPSVTSSATYLQSSAVVPSEATGALGLSVGNIVIPSVEYAAEEQEVCRGSTEPECIVSVSFMDRVDTIIILYGTTKISIYRTESHIYISGIEFGCDCRCSATSRGTREITVPVPGITNQCLKSSTNNPKIECDMLGTEWCEQDEYQQYVIIGNQLPSGNFPCNSSTGSCARIIQPFNEVSPF